MPCRTEPDEYSLSSQLARTFNGLSGAQLEAALCAIMHVLTEMSNVGADPDVGNLVGRVFDRADWKEAGVTRSDVGAWWMRHLAADEVRREREAREREAEERHNTLVMAAHRKLANAGLTKEEATAIGLTVVII